MAIVWKEMTAEVGGSIVKFATCDKCGTEYAFTVFRSARGQGVSLYFLDNEGAHSRALARARETLECALINAVDPVPCPKCGHFPPDIAREARRRYRPWMNAKTALVALGAWILLSALLLYLNFIVLNPGPVVPWNYLLVTEGAVAVAILFLPVVRLLLARNYDPDAETPESRAKKGFVGGIERRQFEEMKASEESLRKSRRHRR